MNHENSIPLTLQGKIILCGDIHSHVGDIERKLTESNITQAHLILLGDCGFGITPSLPKQLAELSIRKTLKIYCLRGNHDNPAYFTGKPYSDRLVCLKDYAPLHINGKTALSIGGAVSIDRLQQQKRNNWWPNEILPLAPSKLEDISTPLDILLTHTGFTPACLPLLQYDPEDPGLSSDLQEEQSRCFTIYDKLKPGQWFYGHYHTSQTWREDTTRIHVLDTGELYELSSDYTL